VSIKLRIAVCTLLLAVMGLLCGTALADQSVELIVYFSPKCDHCTLVREQVLEPLQEAYGEKLVITYVDVSQAEGLSRLEAEEARIGTHFKYIPVLQLGEQLFSDEDIFQLEDTLKAMLRERLGEPGRAGGATATVVPSASSATKSTGSSSQPAIHLAYVQKDGCAECARAAIVIEALQKEYPAVSVHTLNDMRDTDLIEAIGQHLGIPESQRLVAPSIYVGQDALIDTEITSTNLRALLDKYSATGAEAFWEGLSKESGGQSIAARFRSMGPWAVAVAAAIDGVNPCAFATIIFFVWYLAVSARPRREMILVGLAFALGVFATYFAVGMGAVGLLQLAGKVRVVGKVLYGIFAASCFVFAALSVRDYTLARKGQLKEMTLRLPDSLRERIKGRIRKLTGAFVGVTFISGAFIALVELACTGQVYLPTITFMIGVPQMRAQATLYLLLYNLVFVLPLVIVLFLVVYGASPARFQGWLTRNTARTKLLTALLFLALGVLLLFQTLSA